MKCDNCGKRDASIHLTEVINDKVTKLHLCDQCAKEKSKEMQSQFGLTDLLSGLMDFSPDMPEETMAEEVRIKCPVCGMTYYDFQRTGRFGCGGCYESFSSHLGDLFRRIHGADRHVGKMPVRSGGTPQDAEEIQRLKNELNELVSSEEFEKAAVMRDRIKDIETKMKNGEHI